MPNLLAICRIKLFTAALMFSAAMFVLAVPQASSQTSSQIATGAQQSANDTVQIEADAMEVDQDQQRATFTGNVDAVQGNVHIQSDTLTIDYDEVATTEGSSTDVTFLHARGNVVVNSKGQTVEAEWARMDVQRNTVLFGDDVTVRDGQNVLRGTQLELDLDTGESRMTGGRVQGTFFRSDE